MKTSTMKTALILAAIGGLTLIAACSYRVANEQGGVAFNGQDGRDGNESLEDVSVGTEDNAGGQYDGGTGNNAGFYFEDMPPSGNVRTDHRALPQRVYENSDDANPDGRAGTGEPYSEFYKKYDTNPLVDSEDDRLSTFATDVDTGSYTKSRDRLNRGHMPDHAGVRVEEFVNYFDYDYESPAPGETFNIEMDAAPSKYGRDLKNAHLLRIGMQAKRIDVSERKPANLTFVIDTSGSMDMENRLGLVKRSLELLIDQMDERDTIGIAAYGSRGYKVLDHTPASERATIKSAINRLTPDGSTYAEEGIRIGYEMADAAFRKGYINRVILCSDGVANVGSTGHDEILETIAEQRRKGITLSTIGVGMNNYNDTLLEQLGNKGDGRYAYVDTIEQAKRVFVDNLTGTLQVVARDTKVQVEFNPEVVKSWRLLGYENRDVRDEDFRNDDVDGGEIGAGHSVTALYEVKLFDNASGPIATATVRYKHDERDEFLEVSKEFATRDVTEWERAPADMRLAANVAEFAELLKESYWAKGGGYDPVLDEVKELVAETDDNDVLDLAGLIVKARDLDESRIKAAAGGE